MDRASLEKYRTAFGRISRNANRRFGAPAPHKPILLLAVLDEIERGNIHENRVVLTPSLMMVFHGYWQQLADPSRPAPRIAYPFGRLQSDGFWNLMRNGQIVAPKDGDYSVRELQEEYDGASFPPDLWLLLQEREAISSLRRHLFETFFGRWDLEGPRIDDLLRRAAERLRGEAKARFRIRQVRETGGDWYYVRHSLFPSVIKGLYHDSCAVCRIDVRLPRRAGIIEAAHILGFSDYHNDDPRNGIALCKNHHAGFDAGMFSLTDDYRIIVNPSLQNNRGFVDEGALILLPDDSTYYPDQGALREHRALWKLGRR